MCRLLNGAFRPNALLLVRGRPTPVVRKASQTALMGNKGWPIAIGLASFATILFLLTRQSQVPRKLSVQNFDTTSSDEWKTTTNSGGDKPSDTPTGWRVIKDSPGEQEMEYDDGNGNRRYIYRKSWGGTFNPQSHEEMEALLGNTMREFNQEFEAMLKPLMLPFGNLFPELLGNGSGLKGPMPWGHGMGSDAPEWNMPRQLGPEGRGDAGFRDFINENDQPRRSPPRL